jgi:hypothetical protein
VLDDVIADNRVVVIGRIGMIDQRPTLYLEALAPRILDRDGIDLQAMGVPSKVPQVSECYALTETNLEHPPGLRRREVSHGELCLGARGGIGTQHQPRESSRRSPALAHLTELRFDVHAMRFTLNSTIRPAKPINILGFTMSVIALVSKTYVGFYRRGVQPNESTVAISASSQRPFSGCAEKPVTKSAVERFSFTIANNAVELRTGFYASRWQRRILLELLAVSRQGLH